MLKKHRKWIAAVPAVVALALAGAYGAHALATGEHVSCDTATATAVASVPPITYGDGGTVRSGTIPGASDTETATKQVCVTATDQTVTVTDTGGGTTTTPPTTTTTPPPPPPTTLPCGSSLQAAYSGASPGADILLGSCAYTGATFSGSKTGMVTIEAAPGASPTVSGGIVNSASFLTLRGIASSGTLDLAEGNQNAANIVFDKMKAKHFLIGPGHDVTLSNSDIDGTGSGCTDENKVGPDGNIPNAVPYNIKLIGNFIHDQNCQNVGGPHFGGLFLIAGHHFLLSGNTFARNVVYDIQIQNFAGSAFPGALCGTSAADNAVAGFPACLTIQNNWFAGPVEWLPNGTQFDNQPNVQFDCRANACAYRNVLVRFNSFYDGVDFRFDGANALTNVRAVGNIGGGANCSGAAYTFNVWADGVCASTDKQAPKAFVNGGIASFDYHLTGGVAVDLVPGANSDQQLPVDKDGQARPLGAGYDAGSDELG
jgi:hypothetical protein